MESEDKINAFIDLCIEKRIKSIEDELVVQEEMIRGVKESMEEMVKYLQGKWLKLDLGKVHGETLPGPSSNSSRRSSQKSVTQPTKK